MKSKIYKHIIIRPGSVLTLRYLLSQDHRSWDITRDAALPVDRRPIIHTPYNFALVMGVYPNDAQSQSFRLHLN